MIEIRNLRKTYGKKEALKDFSYTFEDGIYGMLGANGKGKTTFCNLLLGKYEYTGSINTNTVFDYFPYTVTKKQMEECSIDLLDYWKSDCELWRVLCEMEQLQIDPEVLYRPFCTLSHGERTKVMLAVLFSRENDFLLIDEPTMLIVEHDIRFREKIGTKVVEM